MWEQIRSNQVRSMVMVVGLGLLLLVLGYFLGRSFFESGTAGIVLALIVWGVMNLVAYFQGDSILLSISGARKIKREDNPRLYNIVEEMKIASGLAKMPDIYIIDDPALNAFATGRSPDRASVAITSGLLQRLNRDELQGVIAHEISHINNRDVLLMMMASILMGTIVILSWYASRVLFYGGAMRSRRSSRDSGGGQIIILAVAIVLMILAPIAAQLMYFAISRRREYLADASGALYTRYPEGLASALGKIATSAGELKSANKATAPMYIVNPFSVGKRSLNDLTSTHPPIADRIRTLRSMAGVSYLDYEQAYRQAHHGRGVVPASAVTAAKSAPALEKRGPSEEKVDNVEQTRETNDLMWRLHNYKQIDCECGTRIKVPPNYPEPAIQCPHCGRINPVP